MSLLAGTAGALMASTAAARGLTPLLVSGSSCPPGSARQSKWIMFEDRNGDGAYDFVVAGDCDGTVRGREWRVSSDPFDPTAGDIVIGRLPGSVTGVVPQLSYQETPGGLYAWIISDRDAGDREICSYQRTVAMELTSTCPPSENLY